MKPFLKELAEKIIARHTKPEELTIVFPNRRAALFFRKYLAELLAKPIWSPNLISIEELFAQQQLGNVPEDQWKVWVDGLAGVGNFMNSGVPDSRGFEKWQDWAEQFVGIMSIG